MAIIQWTERTAQQIFGDNPFYLWLTSIFADRNHTHSEYASSSHNHGDWAANTANLSSPYFLYTNTALRLCILYVNGVASGSLSANTAKTVRTFSSSEIPNPPVFNSYGNSSDPNHNVRLTSNRELQVMGGTASSGGISIATQFMWHY